MAYVAAYDQDEWDCSCGREGQPMPHGFDGYAKCDGCGAEFDFELDGDTFGGFYFTSPTELNDPGENAD